MFYSRLCRAAKIISRENTRFGDNQYSTQLPIGRTFCCLFARDTQSQFDKLAHKLSPEKYDVKRARNAKVDACSINRYPLYPIISEQQNNSLLPSSIQGRITQRNYKQQQQRRQQKTQQGLPGNNKMLRTLKPAENIPEIAFKIYIRYIHHISESVQAGLFISEPPISKINAAIDPKPLNMLIQCLNDRPQKKIFYLNYVVHAYLHFTLHFKHHIIAKSYNI